jgi:hypothetical protein
MNYKTDTTRLSVLVVTILLVGSSFAFLPAFAASSGARTSAVKISPTANSSPPQVAGAPNVIIGGVTATAFSVSVTNPSTNAYAIVSITVIAPSGWSFSGTPTCGTDLTTKGANSSTAVQCTIVSGGSGLPPGFTDTIHLGKLAGPTSVSTSPPILGTFTTLVVDQSSTASYAGSSFSEWTIATTTVSAVITGTPTQYTAGAAALTITATLTSGQSGVPIVFSFTTTTYPTSGYPSTLSPSSTTTGSGGTATTSWAPSNHNPDATTVTATIGNSAITGATGSVITIAGAPSKVSFYFKVAGTSYATDYLTAHITPSTTTYAESGGELSLSLSDAYANPVTLSANIANITISASGGNFLIGAATIVSTLYCGTASTDVPTATCRSGSAITFPVTSVSAGAINYIQSSIYGAVGALSAVITTVSPATSYTGTSGSIVTSTFAGSLTAPVVPAAVAAGSSATVTDTLVIAQQGVPVTLNLCATCGATSVSYNAKFSSGTQSITLYTNSSGIVTTTVAVNVTVASTAVFNATAAAPTTAAPTTVLASPVSGAVTTTVGAISTLVINIAASGSGTPGPNIANIINGTTAYVDVAYADAYGNLIPLASAPHNQIQISLSANNGALLSATNVYIASGQVSTNGTGSIGSIQLTMPKTVGTAVVVTGTGVVNGKTVSGTSTITTVSAAPALGVSSPTPLSGTIYANTTLVTFKGTANASLGSLSTHMATIGYKVGSAQWQSVATPSLHNVVWSIPIILTAGLNTVTFNATDNEATPVTTVGPAWTVLVDTSAPTFGTPTVSGSSANLNITSAMGDLNATSVKAWYNGTAVSASAITVTGTNKPGSSVTYAVSVSGLPVGTWSLQVSAKTLAGTSGSTTATVKVTQVSGTSTFTFVTPKYYLLGPYHTVNVTVTNTQAATITAVVFAVVHNAAGQTLEVSTSTVSVAAGSTSSAFVVVNQPAGTYSVNVFVWSTSGSSLSASSTVSVTY